MANGPIPPILKENGVTGEQFKDMSEATANLFVKVLQKQRDGARQDVDVGKIGDQGIDGGFFNTLNQTANQINQIDRALKDLNEQGLNFARDPAFQRGMKTVTESLDMALGSAERGAKTYAALFSQLKGFAQMSTVLFSDPTKGPARVNKQTRDLSDSLAEQAAILKDLGFSLSDFSANIDSAVYSFGLNKQEVLDFNLQLKDLANNLQMMPSEVSRNFQLVSKNLAYDLSTIKDEFVKIQRLSLGTGVDTQTIVSTFGKRMDTIQGSSGAAASLNQILGDQVFSGNQLLRMTESERAEKIRAAFMNNEALMTDIKQGGISSKFALQSVSEALPGMDEDQIRRFILTGKKDAVKRDVAGRVGDQTTEVEQKKFRDSIANYRDALDQGTKEVLNNLSELRQVQIRARAAARREEIQTGRPGFISQIGITSMLGPMPGKVDNELAARAFDAGGGEGLKRVIALAQMGAITPQQLNDIMRGLTDTRKGGANQIKARLKIQEFTRGVTGQKIDEELEARLNTLPRPVRGAIDSIRELSPFTARQIIKELAPGGLLSGEGAESTDLFQQLKELGDELDSNEEATVEDLARGADDGSTQFSILKGLRKVDAARTAMQKRTASGKASVKATREYIKALQTRGGAFTGDSFKVGDLPTRQKFNELQRQKQPKVPTRRGELPEGLPDELQGSVLGVRDIQATVVIRNNGAPIKEGDVEVAVRLEEKLAGALS